MIIFYRVKEEIGGGSIGGYLARKKAILGSFGPVKEHEAGFKTCLVK
jgi:hypothetical protein